MKLGSSLLFATLLAFALAVSEVSAQQQVVTVCGASDRVRLLPRT